MYILINLYIYVNFFRKIDTTSQTNKQNNG